MDSPRKASCQHSLWRFVSFFCLLVIVPGLSLAWFTAAPALAADGWVTQVTGAPVKLTDIACANASVAWAVGLSYNDLRGGEGRIFATTDGGATWTAQTGSSPLPPINGVACVDASNAWVVGGWAGATILGTTDGGATWITRYSNPAGPDLMAITFASQSDGWAVGRNDTILATKDGGRSWQVQHSDDGGFLADVVFANADVGWAVGWDRILATTDGGATWKVQSAGGAPLNGVACASASVAWAVGPSGRILGTVDGGATWKVQRTGEEVLASVAFANASVGWAVGGTPWGSPQILSTTNGGRTWVAQPPPEGTQGYRLFGVAVADPSHTWAVGADDHGARGTIFHTTNGGLRPPSITGFTPTRGPQGTTVLLDGSGFSGAKAVRFNGVAAPLTVLWDARISATVPHGASPGKITVVTPGGAATSGRDFHAIATPVITLGFGGLSNGVLRLGERVTLRGTVKPLRLSGHKVVLIVRCRAGHRWWVKVASIARNISDTGAFRATYRPTRRGSYRVRASMDATADNTAAETSWGTFRVR